MDPRSIRRWKNENVFKKKQKTGRKSKISFKEFMSLMFHVFQGNNLTQQEMADYLLKEKGLVVSRQAVSRALKKYKITNKKITYHYANQLKYAEEIKNFKSMIEPLLLTSSILALDECSFHLNEAPRRSYAMKGYRASYRKPGSKGDNHTLILCIQNVAGKGIISYKLIKSEKEEKKKKGKIKKIKKGTRAVDFHKFIKSIELPTNEKYYLLLDNARIHHATKACQKKGLSTIRELLVSKNIEPTYLPPYSPELNPVELCFNSIRKSIEKQKPRTFEELKSATDKAIAPLQREDLTKYFRHCLDCFDENGVLVKQERKKVKQGISSSKLPPYWPQITRLFKRQSFSDPSQGSFERIHPKIKYIEKRKSGQSFRAW